MFQGSLMLLWNEKSANSPTGLIKDGCGRGAGRRTHILVLGHEFVHVARRVRVRFLVISKDKDGDIDGAKDGELVCLFEEATLSLEKSSAQREAISAWGRRPGEKTERGERECLH